MDISITILKILVYAIPFFSAAYIIFGIRMFNRKGKDTANYFSLLMIACSIYTMGYFLELNTNTYEFLIHVRNFEFFGSALIPTFGILFIIQFTNRKVHKVFMGFLFTVSATLWILLLTNPFHNLIYTKVDFQIINTITVVFTQKGILYYSMLIHYIVFIIFSGIALFKEYKEPRNIKEKKSILFLLLSFQVSWGAVIIILTGMDKYFDPTPPTIMIVCVLIVINELTNDMFNNILNNWKISFDNIDDQAILTDRHGEIICCNVAAQLLFNKNKQSSKDMISELALNNKNRTSISFVVDNQEKWFVVHINSFDAKNNYYTYLLIDVTSQKNIENLIRKSESRQKAMIAGISDVIAIMDADGKIKYQSPNVQKWFGWLPEDILGTNGGHTVYPDDKQRVQEKLFRLNEKDNITETVEFRYRCKDETYKWIELTATNMIHDYDINGVLINYHDISERKNSQEKIMASEEQYRLLTTQMQLGLALHDIICDDFGVPIDYRFVSVNAKFEELTQLKKSDIIGKTALEILPNTEKYWIDVFGIVALSGEPINYENYSAELGRYYSVSAYSPKIGQFAVLIEDITKRKEIENAIKESKENFRQISENVEEVFWLRNKNNNEIIYVNPAYEKIWGRSCESLYNNPQSFVDAVYDKDREILNNEFQKYISSGHFDLEYRIVRPDGELRWVRAKTFAVKDDDGNVFRYAGIASDITTRKLMEHQIYAEKELLKATLLSVGDGVITVDVKCNILIMNEISQHLTGWRPDDARGRHIDEVFYIKDSKTDMRLDNPAKKAIDLGRVIESDNNTILVSKDGIEKAVEIITAPIRDENQNIMGVVLVFRDFTEKKQKQNQIEYLSYNDQLTGLYNRRYYEKEIVRLDEERYYPLTLVMADVNGLKLTNDAFGHKKGDYLLQRISEILKSACRENDIVARIGGDEFVLLLPETDTKNAEVVIERIIKAIKNEKIDNVVLSVSIGYAVKENISENFGDIFMMAEDDMYRHKLSESSSMRSKTINLIMKTLFENNVREMIHSQRVSELCQLIASHMGLSEEKVSEIRVAGLMHDIGKIGISNIILNASSSLNKNDWDEVKRHPEIGYRILNSANEFSHIANYVLQHHEKLDGTGYPNGLKGEDISIQARIIAIADAFDAMTKSRPYKNELSIEDALSELVKFSGTQFDPDIVKIFIDKKIYSV